MNQTSPLPVPERSPIPNETLFHEKKTRLDHYKILIWNHVVLRMCDIFLCDFLKNVGFYQIVQSKKSPHEILEIKINVKNDLKKLWH